MSKLDTKGWEIPDQTPVAIPAHIKFYDTRDSIRDMIRQELSKEAYDAGYESFEEADDFDVGDDFDPTSPYEEEFDPETGYSLWDRPVETIGSVQSDDESGSSPQSGDSGTTPDEGNVSQAEGAGQ